MAKKSAPEQLLVQASASFITSTGFEVPCKPVNRWLIDTFVSSKKILSPPLYKVTSVAGTVESFYHDAKSVVDAPVEEQHAYTNYIEESARIEAEYNRNFFELLVLYGTEVHLPDNTAWLTRLNRLGITGPDKFTDDDPESEAVYQDKLYIFYISNIAFGIEEDATDLMTHVMTISGTDKEVADQLKRSFRAAIQEARDKQHQIARKRTLGQ